MKPAICSLLQSQAKIIQTIRKFFSDRAVLEVSTPILAAHTIPDPAIESFQLASQGYLQTSPEFFMKRLLAAGSGCIYQIAKVFRKEEQGRIHQSEFTMLEWYRLGFDDHALMAEVDELMQQLAGTQPAAKITYADLFQQVLSVDVSKCSQGDLRVIALEQTTANVTEDWSTDEILDLLFCERIEPFLKTFTQPVFVYHFPETKAALARVVERDSQKVAARFELFYQGIELANGFYELNDSEIQRQRFEQDNRVRMARGQQQIAIDEQFIQSLAHLPECSGVALGIDRLMMLVLGKQSLDDINPFLS